MKPKRILLVLVPLCFQFAGCAEIQAGVGLDPDITIDYVSILDPTERKAAIERDLKAAREAVNANPKSFDAQMQLGKMLRENGDNKGAIESYSKAIEVDSGNIRGYKQRSMTYFSTEQFDEATKDLEEALKLKPNDPALLNQLSYSHMQAARKSSQSNDTGATIKNLDALISGLESQLKANPEHAVYRSRLAAAHLAAGNAAAKAKDRNEAGRRYQLAAENFQKCVNGNYVGNGPPYGNKFFQAQSRAGLAQAYLALDKPEEALKTATAVPMEEIPNDALIPLYMCQMRAYEKLSNEARAAEIEKKLESLGAFHKKPEPPKFPAELNFEAQEKHRN